MEGKQESLERQLRSMEVEVKETVSVWLPEASRLNQLHANKEDVAARDKDVSQPVLMSSRVHEKPPGGRTPGLASRKVGYQAARGGVPEVRPRAKADRYDACRERTCPRRISNFIGQEKIKCPEKVLADPTG